MSSPADTVRIVPMASEHCAAVHAIEAQCFSQPWSEAALRAEAGKESSVFVVALAQAARSGAEAQEAVAGYAGAQCVLDEGYITNVAVDASFRRQGIARHLLAALDEAAKMRGLSFLTLEVRVSNRAAIALYERCGYRQEGLRRGFYQKPREDALLYTKRFK